MAKRLGSVVRWFIALLACQGGAALAQNDVYQPLLAPEGPTPAAAEARLQAVEDQLQRLIASQPQQESSQAPPTLEMAGLVQVDYLFIGQNAANRAAVGDAEDTFGFRRARLMATGEVAEVVSYAIGFDFALAGRPSFLDNWVAVGGLPVLGNVRVGHFFEPFSLERYTLVRYTTFMERSLADTLAPARNLGMMAHDTVGYAQRATWAIGWYRSDSDVFGDDAGDNGGWAVTTRGTWLPIYDESTGGRSLVHLGTAFSYRTDDDERLRFSSFPEARAGSPTGGGIPPFVDTGEFAGASEQRLGLEFAAVLGSLYVQAEYIGASVERPAGDRLFFQGAYAFASYFLTGEHRTYDKERGTFDRVYPLANFLCVASEQGRVPGPGAWEIAARWSVIDLDSREVRGGTLNDLTLALNWHLNPYARAKWEYIHARLEQAMAGSSAAHIAGMRFEIDF